MTITIKAIEYDNADEAIQHMDAAGWGHAISIGNKYLVVEREEADRIEAMGIEFAYLHDREMPDGTHRIVTVPVND
jgi:hypothetical protein